MLTRLRFCPKLGSSGIKSWVRVRVAMGTYTITASKTTQQQHRTFTNLGQYRFVGKITTSPLKPRFQLGRINIHTNVQSSTLTAAALFHTTSSKATKQRVEVPKELFNLTDPNAKRKTVYPAWLKMYLLMVTPLIGYFLVSTPYHNIETVQKTFNKYIAMPMLHCLDAETAHVVSIYLLLLGLGPIESNFYQDTPALKVDAFGLTFRNCIGIAAGYDKHAQAIDGLFRMGAGFVEIGSVTPLPQEGNDKPRMFRLSEDGAVINRYGFNSDGHDTVQKRLEKRLGNERDASAKAENYVLGVNLGKNKTSPSATEDYGQGIEKLGRYADYIVINVSSPNTPGLRNLQGRDQLMTLLDHCVKKRDMLDCRKKPPLLVKIAPDLDLIDLQDIAYVVKKINVDGIIISNTTIARPDSLQSSNKAETGGLSGTPLFQQSTTVLAHMYKLTEGKIPLIGVGGISNGADAYEKIKAGATVVQLYSALGYKGPGLLTEIKREMNRLLQEDGYSNIAQAVGKDNKSITNAFPL